MWTLLPVFRGKVSLKWHKKNNFILNFVVKHRFIADFLNSYLIAKHTEMNVAELTAVETAECDNQMSATLQRDEQHTIQFITLSP